MQFSDLPADVLRRADTITLFDPNNAGWHLLLVALSDQRGYDALKFVHIPVDSTNAATVQGWRDHVAAIRAT